METEKNLKKFVDASIKYGEALEMGDSPKANRYSKIIRNLRKQFRDEKNTELLYPFLDNQNNYIKLNVAVSLMEVRPDVAEKVLIELSTEKGLFSVEAQMFLNEWKKGTIVTR